MHSDVVLAIMVTTIVGMVLSYRIIRLILIPKDERGKTLHGKEKRRKRRHDSEPFTVDPASLERLVERAEDLGRRVATLEEIVAADKVAERSRN